MKLKTDWTESSSSSITMSAMALDSISTAGSSTVASVAENDGC